MSVAEKPVKKPGTLGELVTLVFQAALIAMVIYTFIFQNVSIPSGSMRPTLLEGDYLTVAKWKYGYSHFSFPFSPNFFSGRIWGAAPKRGDVVVFRFPKNLKEDYIKRVIGLPGDRVQMRDDQLFLNGVAVPRVKVGEIDNPDITEKNGPVAVYRETLPNGVSYETLDLSSDSWLDNTKEVTVPAGHYFVMGDNRDNSDDSRASVGFVPEENLIGKATMIYFSIADATSPLEVWKWPSSVRGSRLFTFIH